MKSGSWILRAAILLGTFGSHAKAQDQIIIDPSAPPGGGTGFKIKSIQFNGSGCPLGENTEYLQQGDTLWLKLPSSMQATSGPDSPLSSARKNCVATLRFAESFQTYAIDSVAWIADLGLPKGVKSTVRFSWFHEGQAHTGSLEDARVGPASASWYDKFSNNLTGASLVWKPCGLDRALNINSEIRISESADTDALAHLKIVGLRFKKKNCLSLGF